MSTAAPSRALSLAHLTLLGLAPADLIDVAARAGYPFVGLRLLPAAPGGPAYPLMNDAVALRETLARMAASGVRVFDLEIVRLDERFDVARLLPLLEVGARLGARTVLVGADDTDAARRARSYAALCEAARGFGLAACIEFMPWTAVKNLRDATQLIEMAGRPANAGLLVDALHFARSQSTLPEVAALPREWLHYAQICDAPAEIPARAASISSACCAPCPAICRSASRCRTRSARRPSGRAPGPSRRCRPHAPSWRSAELRPSSPRRVPRRCRETPRPRGSCATPAGDRRARP
jgi:sugar phosphate isomerase/epimerase